MVILLALYFYRPFVVFVLKSGENWLFYEFSFTYKMTFLNRNQGMPRLVLAHMTHIWFKGTLAPFDLTNSRCGYHQASLWVLFSVVVYQTSCFCPCREYISSFLHGCCEALLIRHVVGVIFAHHSATKEWHPHSTSLSKVSCFKSIFSNFLSIYRLEV